MKKLISVLAILIICGEVLSFADYTDLRENKYCLKNYTDEKLAEKTEKAYKRNSKLKYLGRMTKYKYDLLRSQGLPDIIGKDNMKTENDKKIEEWIYIDEKKDVLFREKSGILYDTVVIEDGESVLPVEKGYKDWRKVRLPKQKIFKIVSSQTRKRFGGDKTRVFSVYSKTEDMREIEKFAKTITWFEGDFTMVYFFGKKSRTPNIKRSGENFAQKYRDYCLAGYWKYPNGNSDFKKYPFKLL